MFRSVPIIDRIFQFFTLPNCYLEVIKFSKCNKSRVVIALDLMELFYKYKTFPDNYTLCRLWEVEKSKWKFFYGSNYHPYQRAKLRRKLQPSDYMILFNDKAVCVKLCRGIGVPMPQTHGTISPEQNYKEKIISWFQNSAADSFFIKPLLGRAGRGIVVAKRIDNNIIIQSKKGVTPLHDFDLMEGAIVQDVVIQDSRIAAFSSSSVNTIRIVTMYTKKESVIIVGAYMRFGVGESYVDNWSAGGVSVGVDDEKGKLKKYAYDNKGKKYIEHPTSKIVFEGFTIPNWKRIIDITEKIQKACPFFRMLGMDIALQENGEPVLIEVNAHPDLCSQEQRNGPLLQDEKNLKAFGEYDLLINKHQKQLYSNLVNS